MMDGLTPRENECLALMATGMSNGAIGTQLSLARKSIDNYLHSVYSKMGILDPVGDIHCRVLAAKMYQENSKKQDASITFEQFVKRMPSHDIDVSKLEAVFPIIRDHQGYYDFLIAVLGALMLAQERGLPEDLLAYCHPLGFYPNTYPRREEQYD